MLTYDDRELQRMLNALEPRRRRQALKGGFSKAATRVRQTAVRHLRKSGLRQDKTFAKGIRRLVYRKTLGFRVTIGSKESRKKRLLARQNGEGKDKKHILLWAEGGTRERRTKARVFKRRRRSHSTGRMPEYGFMKKTKEDVKDGITEYLQNDIRNSIRRIAKKYGCT